jgi:acyl carrier protein
MDSLDVTETVMDLEDEFEASIPDDDVGTIQTVAQLIDYVKAHFPAPREKEQTPP